RIQEWSVAFDKADVASADEIDTAKSCIVIGDRRAQLRRGRLGVDPEAHRTGNVDQAGVDREGAGARLGRRMPGGTPQGRIIVDDTATDLGLAVEKHVRRI